MFSSRMVLAAVLGAAALALQIVAPVAARVSPAKDRRRQRLAVHQRAVDASSHGVISPPDQRNLHSRAFSATQSFGDFTASTSSTATTGN